MAKSTKKTIVAQATQAPADTSTVSTVSTVSTAESTAESTVSTVSTVIEGFQDMASLQNSKVSDDDKPVSTEENGDIMTPESVLSPDDLAKIKAENEKAAQVRQAESIANMLAIIEASAEVAPQAPKAPPATQKTAEPKKARREVATLDKVEANDHHLALCLLILGKFVQPADVLKFVRMGVRSPAWSNKPTHDYKALAMVYEQAFKVYKIQAESAPTSKYEDRVAVNGASFIDIADLIVDKWESQDSSVWSTPEISLGVRWFMQWSTLINGKLAKTLNIGDSSGFKHISATPRNVIAWLKHSEVSDIAFYDEKTPLNVILADYIDHIATFDKIDDGKGGFIKRLTPESLYCVQQLKSVKPHNYGLFMKFECLHDYTPIHELDTCTAQGLVFMGSETPDYNSYFILDDQDKAKTADKA